MTCVAGNRRSVQASALLSTPMPPTSRILALVIASFALAAPASAADPLLSGYSGPGGGEQALLGSELLPAPAPGGREGGSLQAPVRAAVPEVGKAPIAVIAAAAPLTKLPPQPRGAGRSTQPRGSQQPGRRGGKQAARSNPVAAVTYPATSSDAEILSPSTVLGLLLAGAALLGIALGTARLAGRPIISNGVPS